MNASSDRQDIAHHYRTWLNRQVAKEIGHDGQLTLEEFCFRLNQLEGVIPDAPYPGIQVARGEGGFVWNDETIQGVLYEVWGTKKRELASVHLSAHAYGRWQAMTREETGHYTHIYDQALRQVRLASKRGEGLTLDKAIKRLRASTVKPTTLTTPRGKVVTLTSGLCLTCGDRLKCAGLRDGATRCNDYLASSGTPVKAPQTPVLSVRAGGEGKRIAPPLLRCGI